MEKLIHLPSLSTSHAESIPTNWSSLVIFPGWLPSNVNHWLTLFKCGPTAGICDSGGVTLWNNYFTGLRSMLRAENKQHRGWRGKGGRAWRGGHASASCSLSLSLSSGQRFMGDVLDLAAAQKKPPPLLSLPSSDPTAAASAPLAAPAQKGPWWRLARTNPALKVTPINVVWIDRIILCTCSLK